MTDKFEAPLKLGHLLLGLTLTILGGAFTAGVAWSSISSDVQTLKEGQSQMRELSTEVHKLQNDVSEIKADIRWIRENLKR